MSDAKKTDAEKLDAILGHLDSASKKLDSFEKRMDAVEETSKKMDAACARVDAACSKMDAADKEREEEKKADAARKDAEEKEKEEKAKKDAEDEEKAKKDAEAEEEKKKADAAKADAAKLDAAGVNDLIAKALAANAPKILTPEVRQRMTAIQAKWEPVAQALDSAGAEPFLTNESEIDYRVRLASKYQKYSKNPKIKEAKLSAIQDSASLEVMEDAIHMDALAEATRPTEFKPGMLIPIKHTDGANRVTTSYRGDPNACWDQFNPPIRYVRKLLTPGTTPHLN